jgi:hypothetical protein
LLTPLINNYAVTKFKQTYYCFLWRDSTTRAKGRLSVGVSSSHSDTPHTAQLLWTGGSARRTDLNLTHNTHDRHPCPRAEFELAVPAREQPQTHALDSEATGIGNNIVYNIIIIIITFIMRSIQFKSFLGFMDLPKTTKIAKQQEQNLLFQFTATTTTFLVKYLTDAVDVLCLNKHADDAQ